MKSSFPEYYRPTDAEFRSLWNQATFAFDANVLLHVYRYSEETARQLIALITTIADRTWVPHRFAFEFHRKRYELILEQASYYKTVSKNLNTILEEDFKSRRKHPFVKPEILHKLEQLFTELTSALAEGEKKHEALLKQDNYLDTLTELFSEKIGTAYSEEQQAKLHEDARKRFGRKIPPGYKDEKKPEPDRYGDYLAWRQLLDHAKDTNKPIILISDDNKEDWWLQIRGDITIGPRPELIAEFLRETNQKFYMYSAESFMEHARNYLGAEVTESAIQEAKEQREKAREDTVNLKAEPMQAFVHPKDPKPTATGPIEVTVSPPLKAESSTSAADSPAPQKGI